MATRIVGTRTVERFEVMGTSGRRYMIVATATLHDVRTHDDLGAAPIEGLPSLRTAAGFTVTPLPGGQFQIVQTGEVLTRL